MAKAYVKCFYCGEQFDRNSEPAIKVNARRYAHEKCHLEHEKNKTQEEIDSEELYKYAKDLLGDSYSYIKIQKQVEKYIKEYNYTYSGILKSLVWFYDITNHSKDKMNGGLGIIPYIYDQAKEYYYKIYLAQNVNKGKNIEKYKPKQININIKPPQRKIKRRKFFNIGED